MLALGGLVTVICVAESAMILPPTPPKRTTVVSARPVPVIVTVLPPTVLPPAGDTPVTAGGVTDVWAGPGRANGEDRACGRDHDQDADRDGRLDYTGMPGPGAPLMPTERDPLHGGALDRG